MNTNEAIDAFLREERRRSDLLKQTFIPLRVEQDTPPCPQVGPRTSRDPRLRKRRRTVHTQTEVPAPWSEPMTTRPKVWINETATTTATQTDILIDLTLDEPWVEHVHIVERPKSPADNKRTRDILTIARDTIFNILGSGEWQNRIPYKDGRGNFDPQFEKINDIIEEVVCGAQNISKYGHEDQWCPDEDLDKLNCLDDSYTGKNFFK